MAQAMALVPKYGKAVSKKMNSGLVEGTLEIEALFADENLGAKKLIGEFETVRKESIAPAAMCRLFFGRSFGNMVVDPFEVDLRTVVRVGKIRFRFSDYI
jgi:hypothetical protein